VSTAGNVVRVYISTTYEDMHSERDVLAREVFPRLRETFGPRGIHVGGVDLRWGVEGETGEDLEIMLDEIDRSRPFFVAILGERYGRAASVPDDVLSIDRLGANRRDLSLNAIEILHGVLEHPESKKTSFFYFRDPGFSAHVPACKRREFLPESEEAARKLAEIKDRIRGLYRDLPGNLFEAYPCSFAGFEIARNVYRERLALRLAPEDFTIIAGDLETGNLVSVKNLFRLRDEALSVLAEHSVVRLSNLDEFSARIHRDLHHAIDVELPRYRNHSLRPSREEHSLRPRKIADCIERLEEENGKETVKAALSLIACSEEGLYEDELSELTARIVAPLPPLKWARIHRGISGYLRDGGRGGTIEIHDKNFKEEVLRRYIPDERSKKRIYSTITKYAFSLFLAMSSTDADTSGTEGSPLVGLVRHLGIYCLRAVNKNRAFDLIASLFTLPKDRFERYKTIFDLTTEMLASSVPEKDPVFYPALAAVLDVLIETRKDREELARMAEFLYEKSYDSITKGRDAWGKAFAALALNTIEAALQCRAKKSSRYNSTKLRTVRNGILEKMTI